MKNNAKALYVLLVAAFVIAAYNQFALMSLTGSMAAQSTTTRQESGSSYNAVSLQEAIDEVMPKGVPDIYGTALGVNYDNPVEALQIMANLDGDLYENGKIKVSDLSEEQRARYVRMGMSVSCEFCCGAQTLVQPSGQPSCGCAHSAAMRGLMKYLLKNTDMTDGQIMDEVLKVKTISFPQQMVSRYMEQNGLDSGANSLPQQVGGC